MSSSESSESDHEENAFDDIRGFFTSSEWMEINSYEKKSYWSAWRNYKAMLKAGLKARKPHFMMTQSEKDELAKLGTYVPVKPRQPKPTLPVEPSRTSRRIHKKYNCEDDEGLLDSGEQEDLLLCDECHAQWGGDCPRHGPLQVIHNTEVPPNAPDRASRTIPPQLALLPSGKKQSGDDVIGEDVIQGVQGGVWTKEPIPRRVRFGPYEGDTATRDPDDDDTCNWMRYVRTTSYDKPNLRPFQYCGRLYFRTICDIPENCELVVKFTNPGYDRKATCRHCRRDLVHPLLLGQHQRTAPHCSALVQQERRALVEQRKAMLPANVREAERQLKELRRAQMEKERTEREKRRLLGEKRRAKRQRERERFERQNRQLLQQLHQQREDTILATEETIEFTSVDGGAGGARPYKCTTCDQSFRRASLLRAHAIKHAAKLAGTCGCLACNGLAPRNRHSPFDGRALYTCLTCKAAFPNSQGLRDHVVLTHVRMKRFACSTCGDLSSSRGALQDHVRTAHPE